MLVIASLGLQLTTTFVTGRKASQFILKEDVIDIVINEGIFMVLFLLLDILCKIYYRKWLGLISSTEFSMIAFRLQK